MQLLPLRHLLPFLLLLLLRNRESLALNLTLHFFWLLTIHFADSFLNDRLYLNLFSLLLLFFFRKMINFIFFLLNNRLFWLIHLSYWFFQVLTIVLADSFFLVRNWRNFLHFPHREYPWLHLLDWSKDVVRPYQVFSWRMLFSEFIVWNCRHDFWVVVEFSPLSFGAFVDWIDLW